MPPPRAPEATGTGPWTFPQRALLAVTLAGLLVLVWRVADVVILAFGAVVLASILRSLADRLERHLRVPSRLSVLLAVVLLLALVGMAAAFAGDAVSEQMARLRDRLPEAWQAAQGWLARSAVGRQLLDVLSSALSNGLLGERMASLASLTLGGLGSALLMLVAAVYLAADPRTYRAGLVRLAPPAYRTEIDQALRASGRALACWLLGQGLSMLFLGLGTAIGLWWLGVPLALTLGFITGLFAFVPFFGAIAAGLLSVLMAFSAGPQTALYVALMFLALQQIEEYLLLPLLQRWAVALPPVLGLLAAVLFGLLFGPMGVVFATPLMVVLMVLVRRLYVEGLLEREADAASA